jgi:N-acetylneuraminic acid mutarotase
VTSYTLGGTISGLNLSSVVLSNGGSTVTVTSGSSSWQFSSSFAANSNYSVNVQTQPSGEVCQVTGAASGVLTHNVSNVTVVCAMGLWTWQEGSNIANPDGTYGTERTPAASNIPGGRGNGAFWTDASGNFWLFGGAGYPASGSSSGYLNDLWMYSPGSGEWTWESGATTLNSNGVYGTKGVAAAGNAPGGRFRASQGTDAQGNLWLFGGTGYAASGGSAESLSDLWKYSPSSGEWTWVAGPSSGNNNGVYGTKGVAAAANTPGGRSGAAAWVDASGNLWLFGGAGYGASGGSGDLSDLWKFSPSSGEWTWVGGPSTINGSGTYGTKGVAAASNWPGSRFVGASWVDASGNFWLFGGIGYASSGSGNLSDLWQYSSSSGEWTWVSGASSVATYSVYGTQGVAAASNAPGSRYAAVSWIDASGNLWLFGGSGYAASTNGFLNDLWYYTPATGEWTWISGSQSAAQSGLYGTQGTASVSNLPGSRQESHVWLDSSGNLWLFGGYGYDSAGTNGELNDLWQFTLQ